MGGKLVVSRSSELPGSSTPRRRRRLELNITYDITYAYASRAPAADIYMRVYWRAYAYMRVLYAPVVARAPALPLSFRTRLLAPKNPGARYLHPNTRACVLWNPHHTFRMPARQPNAMRPTPAPEMSTGADRFRVSRPRAAGGDPREPRHAGAAAPVWPLCVP